MLRGIDLSSRFQQVLLFGIRFQSFCFRSVPHQFQMAHLLAVENLTAFTSCGRLTQLFFKLGKRFTASSSCCDIVQAVGIVHSHQEYDLTRVC